MLGQVLFAAPNVDVIFEKICEIFGAIVLGKIAAVATAIVAAISAYSIRSCPLS
jgi:hypothetical protein